MVQAVWRIAAAVPAGTPQQAQNPSQPGRDSSQWAAAFLSFLKTKPEGAGNQHLPQEVSVAAFIPPTLMLSARCLRRAKKAGAIRSWTRSREVALQIWPFVQKIPNCAGRASVNGR